jgi:LmbE family N-acetylglucosaminyl deacetylase
MSSLEQIAPAGALAVIAPHPDDETLGCGGLIALAAAAGRKVVVVVMTDGTGSHPDSQRYPPPRLAFLRAGETLAALGALSGERVTAIALGLTDGALEAAAPGEAATVLAALFRLHGVRTVFAPCRDDAHADHRAAYRAARAASDAVGARLWCYPIWAEADAQAPSEPTVRLDISAVQRLKRRAIRRHRSQVSPLIRDARDAFRLSRADIARLSTPWETYYEDAAGGA